MSEFSEAAERLIQTMLRQRRINAEVHRRARQEAGRSVLSALDEFERAHGGKDGREGVRNEDAPLIAILEAFRSGLEVGRQLVSDRRVAHDSSPSVVDVTCTPDPTEGEPPQTSFDIATAIADELAPTPGWGKLR